MYRSSSRVTDAGSYSAACSPHEAFERRSNMVRCERCLVLMEKKPAVDTAGDIIKIVSVKVAHYSANKPANQNGVWSQKFTKTNNTQSANYLVDVDAY